MEYFDKRKKFGRNEYCLKYRDKLENEISEAFEKFKILNNRRKGYFDYVKGPINSYPMTTYTSTAGILLASGFAFATPATAPVMLVTLVPTVGFMIWKINKLPRDHSYWKGTIRINSNLNFEEGEGLE